MAEYVCGQKEVPVIREFILEMGDSLKQGYKRILFLGQDVKFDNRFSGVVYEARYSLPSPIRLTECLNTFIGETSQEFRLAGATLTIDLEASHREEIATAGRGLTETEFLNCLRLDVRERRRVDAKTADLIIQSKMVKLEKLGVKFSPAPDVMPGGYQEFKAWLNRRKKLFSATLTQNSRASRLDLPAPKGCLMVGHPGTGKSLAAKALAATLKVPTLAMDIGSFFNKHVGETEARFREFTRLVESLGPVVLFIDEVEKGLAGAGGESSDGGVTQRLFGDFLTWLNDKTCPAFVVCTSNDISKLPPEFTRKGRFDEIWFADLPTAAERMAIFAVHLQRHQMTLPEERLAYLSSLTDGFVGAEIRAVVDEAALAAFDEDLDTINDAHLISAIADVTPLSVSNADKTMALREWAKTAARNMSTVETVTTPSKQATPKGKARKIMLEE
jgi:SpoVK/Ycf46/Vps4 family AAA+-type ATPase